MISIIVAASTNMVIGKDNQLSWHLPTDLKRFKELTNGKVVYMGRNTWESLPEKFRPLPNRDNIVITRDKDYIAEGAIIVSDLERLKRTLRVSTQLFGSTEQFVIGGGEIYKELLPFADTFYLTEVLTEIEGDTYLEGFNIDEWRLIDESEVIEENGFKFKFKVFVRK